MHIPQMDGSKVTIQFFDILPRSRDIQVQSFTFMTLMANTPIYQHGKQERSDQVC